MAGVPNPACWFALKTASLGKCAAELVTARDIRPEDHIAMLATVHSFVDGAIVKTLNLPADSSAEAVVNLFIQAWQEGLKGLTLFRTGGVRDAVIAQ